MTADSLAEQITDFWIEGSPSLAVRDYGGTGSPVLLLHGAGRTLEDFRPLVRRLSSHHHLYAMDLRGHGLSGESAWSWETALDDVDRVIDFFGLEAPALVGHSLGGMIAVLHALRWPGRDVVNIDGVGPGRPDLIEGEDPAVAEEHIAAIVQAARVGTAALQDMTREQASAVAAAAGQAYGIDPADVDAVVRRLANPDPAIHTLRPGVTTVRAVLDLVVTLDLADAYRESKGRVLIAHAIAAPQAAPGGPPWLAKHQAALHRGMCREFDGLAAASPNIRHVDFNSGHDVHLAMPGDLADAIISFLSSEPAGVAAVGGSAVSHR